MSDSILTVLKFCLLALLYLFLAAGRAGSSPASCGAAARCTAARRCPRRSPRRRRGRARRSDASGAWSSSRPRPNAGASYPIDGDVTIGRGGGCAVPLTFDTFVSQVHARAFDRDGTLWVEDVGLDQRHARERQAHRRADEAAQGRPRAGRRDRARGER